jgi:hypothetical protein
MSGTSKVNMNLIEMMVITYKVIGLDGYSYRVIGRGNKKVILLGKVILQVKDVLLILVCHVFKIFFHIGIGRRYSCTQTVCVTSRLNISFVDEEDDYERSSCH